MIVTIEKGDLQRNLSAVLSIRIYDFSWIKRLFAFLILLSEKHNIIHLILLECHRIF